MSVFDAMRRKFAKGGGQGTSSSSRRPWHRWLNPLRQFVGKGDQ